MQDYIDDREKNDLFHGGQGGGGIYPLTDFHKLDEHEQGEDGLSNGDNG